eukprot:scaffold135119_cov23-Tisochrysis_lutea.AAC.1
MHSLSAPGGASGMLIPTQHFDPWLLHVNSCELSSHHLLKAVRSRKHGGPLFLPWWREHCTASA